MASMKFDQPFLDTKHMSIVYLLLPASLSLGAGALFVFMWALRSGQFDDLKTPAHRILIEPSSPSLESTSQPKE